MGLLLQFVLWILLASTVGFIGWNVVLILRQAAAESASCPRRPISFAKRILSLVKARWTGSEDPIRRPGPGRPLAASFFGRFQAELTKCAIRSRLSWVRAPSKHRPLVAPAFPIAPLSWAIVAAIAAARTKPAR